MSIVEIMAVDEILLGKKTRVEASKESMNGQRVNIVK